MKCYLLMLFSLIQGLSYGQISVTGSSSSNSVANNGPAVVVDAAVTLTSSLSIPAFRVRISSNFSSGDVLSYTATLPSGVTASYASGTGILTFTGASSAANYQALLRSVTFATTSSSASARTITFEAGDGTLSYNSANGHFYNYISGSFLWPAAKADAASKSFFGLQGYLATITSSSENTFVAALSGKGWFGGSDDYTEINTATGSATYANQTLSEGHFYWVTGPEKGTAFSYTNWTSGEPNNSGGNENYIENSSGSATWNDNQVGTFGYILEYGGLGTDPAVSIFFSRTVTMISTQLQSPSTGPTYVLQSPGSYVDPAMTVYSASSTITDGKVTVSSNFNTGDVLSYTGTLPVGVTVSGTGYNATTGVLSFSGTTSPANWQALFRTVKFNSTSNVIGNRTITYSVGNNVAFSNGHFYESVTSTANWTTSKSNAAAKTYLGLQGYLATITSSAENDFIKQKLGTDAWIGLSDSYTDINAATGVTTYANQTASEGKWYWVTGPEKGTQLTTGNAPNSSSTGVAVAGVFNNWNTGEPNNSGGENYGEIYAASAPGKWNDLNGTGSLQYVVEYGGLSTDPAIVLTANTIVYNNSTLPIRGLDFKVSKSGKAVQLDWSTVWESHSDRFDILKSTDGKKFRKIGQVKAQGNSDVKQLYTWKDDNPSSGKNLYRLQEFDIDGASVYSEVREISFGLSEIPLTPNPAYATITIHHENVDGAINIYNASGIKVQAAKISSNDFMMDIHGLSSGVYIAEIIDGANVKRIMFVKK